MNTASPDVPELPKWVVANAADEETLRHERDKRRFLVGQRKWLTETLGRLEAPAPVHFVDDPELIIERSLSLYQWLTGTLSGRARSQIGEPLVNALLQLDLTLTADSALESAEHELAFYEHIQRFHYYQKRRHQLSEGGRRGTKKPVWAEPFAAYLAERGLGWDSIKDDDDSENVQEFSIKGTDGRCWLVWVEADDGLGSKPTERLVAYPKDHPEERKQSLKRRSFERYLAEARKECCRSP